jgi:hypothetical protein
MGREGSCRRADVNNPRLEDSNVALKLLPKKMLGSNFNC